jgi:DNA-directed RNA polymerase subunit RPC12/RpoP
MLKNKSYNTGKNNPNYKTGKYSKLFKNYCIDCHKRIDKRAKRCYKCWYKFAKKENAVNWKGNYPNCIDCGKKLSIRKSKNYIPKRCKKCWNKILVKNYKTKYNKKWTHKNKIIRHHINLNKLNNTKGNILKITHSKHIKLHHYAYNYLVKIGKIKDYIKWFKKYFITGVK